MLLQSIQTVIVVALATAASGLLYPKDSTSRTVKSLDGIWHFLLDNSSSGNESFVNQWYSKPLANFGDVMSMAVPSSYNDITQDDAITLFLGWAWYDRNFWLQDKFLDGKSRVVLRFEGAHYYTIVWVNGHKVLEHEGGHLPFEADVTDALVAGKVNRVTAAVNNTLTPHTIPPATRHYEHGPEYPPGFFTVEGQFDFFNYAGIQRSVVLYTTPLTYIDDIIVVTSLNADGSAKIDYSIVAGGKVNSNTNYSVGIGDAKASGSIDSSGGASGSLTLDNPTLWWPWTLSDTPGQMYPFAVEVIDEEGVVDSYREAVGIREVKVTEDKFLINGKPFYFNGVDKHEDWNIIGKGIDDALLLKDIYLLKWLNVAAIRTSHYPYSEQFLQLCNQEGIVVIGESTAVGLKYPDNFDDVVLQKHLRVMEEMIARDKNKPAIVMWSVANEPASNFIFAKDYFKTVFEKTHTLDPSRPASFACSMDYSDDLATQYADVIMINRYYGWYNSPGHTEVIPYMMRNDLDNWHKAQKKPIIISEYGAGAIPGLRKYPPVVWSEEYQVELLLGHWKTYDEYRKTFLVGELIWNFADFETRQEVNRVDGNHKGILTRQREPKLAAYWVKDRYSKLAQGHDYHPDYTNTH